ncbi:MAG: pilus assembly protein CpaE [Nocardioidaceae bacterium]
MIGDDDARRLRQRLDELGRPWRPGPGDRFRVPDRDLDDQVFVVAEMTIEVVEAIGGSLIHFNGTTEWALDSVAAAEVVWLPWEHQLRELLGSRFASLEALPSPAGGWAVTLDDGRRFAHVSPEDAYLAAVLAALEV